MYKQIKLTKKERFQCEAFADLRCENTTLYKRRGGFKRSDIVTGAMAEIAAYKMLKKCGIKASEPDFTIYEANEKSFDKDLTDGFFHFHVKGQNIVSAKRYGQSCLMQKTDPLLKSLETNHYFIYSTVSLDDNIVDIHCCLNTLDLIIGEPKLWRFRTTKVAIYLDDLKNEYNDKKLWSIIHDKIKERK